jgi:hypothetical protein
MPTYEPAPKKRNPILDTAFVLYVLALHAAGWVIVLHFARKFW